MADGLPGRWIMRQAMVKLFTGSERGLLEQFLRLEAMSGAHDDSVSSQGRVIWSFMVAKALAGEVEVTGHRGRSAPEQIISLGFLVSSHPDFNKHTLLTSGGEFDGVLVRAIATPGSPANEGVKQQSDFVPPDRGRGGRSAKHEWARVAAEVVRIAHMEDLGNRRLLTARMVEWCAKNLDSHPDESSVRKYVTSLCPADLPAE